MIKVNIYGSFSTGLAMPWSDIDLVVSNSTSQDNPYKESKDVLM